VLPFLMPTTRPRIHLVLTDEEERIVNRIRRESEQRGVTITAAQAIRSILRKGLRQEPTK
jgi:hypothetical protein